MGFPMPEWREDRQEVQTWDGAEEEEEEDSGAEAEDKGAAVQVGRGRAEGSSAAQAVVVDETTAEATDAAEVD